MSKKNSKTNAIRVIDSHKISYDIHTYDNADNMIDGKAVADMIFKDYDIVFKTIIAKSKNDYYVFVLPVDMQIDLKKSAVSVNEKSVSLVPIKDIFMLSGYIKGGCSPIGMRKNFVTVFDISAKKHDKILFNAGKVGILVELKVEDISKVIKFSFEDISDNN